jgi:hypothetical protein
VSALPEYLALVAAAAAAKPLPPEASRYYLPGLKALVRLCSELQLAAGTGTFYLACRHAGHLLGVPYRRANHWLRRLEADRLLERVRTGTVGTTGFHAANEYRYLGAQHQHDDHHHGHGLDLPVEETGPYREGY